MKMKLNLLKAEVLIKSINNIKSIVNSLKNCLKNLPCTMFCYTFPALINLDP